MIVSDDGTSESARGLVDADHPGVIYLEGPRRGVAANRNNVVRQAQSDFVLMVDDDIALGERFIEDIMHCLSEAEARFERSAHDIIVTGLVAEGPVVIEPHEQGFLGFQDRAYGPDDSVNTIVLGNTLFPRRLFEEIGFDERLVAVYEEVDLATRAAARGYRIAVCKRAVNRHFPTRELTDRYGPIQDAARLYVTFKRYAFTERRLVRAAAFAVWGPLHLFVSNAKANGLTGVRRAARALALASRYVASYVRDSARKARRQRGQEIR